MASLVPPFEATPIDTIPSIVSGLKATYRSQRTRPVAYRIQQLRALYWALVDNTPALLEACKADLHKSTFETHVTEIDWCKNDIVFVTRNLEAWARDEPAPDMPLPNQLMSPVIRKEPLGTVLVIGCWNFPVQLSLGPLIGAIAAGCTAVLKPSEISPATAMVLTRIVRSALDPAAFAVLNGGKDEATALLDQKWDKIFYTGNARVGTLIASKAAETLTPVTLELGGRNPAIVSRNTDVRLAARRLLWGKFLNAGQVCISHNYTLVDAEVVDAFVEQLRRAMAEFYPQGAKASPDYSRIVSAAHFQRITKQLEASRGTVVIGGASDPADNYIEPTVVIVPDAQDALITEESFGPLLPLLPTANLDEAIRIANDVHATPLGLYAFGNPSEVARILAGVTSGGATVNDALFHASMPTMPFGGVGDSGQGAYRGRASFDCFSHRRPITHTPGWMEKLLEVRYPPYAGKLAKLSKASNLTPNFDRQGRTVRGLSGWLALFFSLGGVGVKAVIVRWALVAAAAVAARRFIESRGALPRYLR